MKIRKLSSGATYGSNSSKVEFIASPKFLGSSYLPFKTRTIQVNAALAALASRTEIERSVFRHRREVLACFAVDRRAEVLRFAPSRFNSVHHPKIQLARSVRRSVRADRSSGNKKHSLAIGGDEFVRVRVLSGERRDSRVAPPAVFKPRKDDGPEISVGGL